MFDERWNDDYEIEQTLSSCGSHAGGPVLYVRGGKPFCYAGENSCLFSGVPGSGKTRCGTIPQVISCLQAHETVILVDIKGEIYRETCKYIPEAYRGHIYKFDFRDVQNSERCDPLNYIHYLYNRGDEKSRELAGGLLSDFAHSVCTQTDKGDPFWNNSAASLFVDAAQFLMQYAEPEQVSVANAFHLVTSGAKRSALSNTVLGRLVSLFPADGNSWKMQMETYATGCGDTSAGIRQVFSTAFSPFVQLPGLRAMADNTFRIQDLNVEQPTLLYLILPDERKEAYGTLAIQLLNQLCSFYLSTAETSYRGRLPVRTNFIIEEAGNLPPLPCLSSLLNAGRSRNLRVALAVQSLSQLNENYGADTAKSICNAASVQVAFRSNDITTCRELSELCGDRWAPGANGQYVSERLLTPAMVHTLPNRSALCLVNEKKWVSRLPDYTEIFPPRQGRCPAVNAPTPFQERRPLFDTALFANAIIKNVLCDAETKPFLKERPRPPVRSLEDLLSSESSETPAPALYSLGIFRYRSRSDVLADCLIRHLKPEPGEVGQAMYDGCPITVRLADCTKLRYLKKELTELGFTVSILNL